MVNLYYNFNLNLYKIIPFLTNRPCQTKASLTMNQILIRKTNKTTRIMLKTMDRPIISSKLLDDLSSPKLIDKAKDITLQLMLLVLRTFC